MVLCFHYGEGICLSWVNLPAMIRKGETLLWGPFCFWNPDEGCESGYLEWGCPRARWGGIHQLGTYKKLRSISNHQRGCSRGGEHKSCLSTANPPESPVVFSPEEMDPPRPMVKTTLTCEQLWDHRLEQEEKQENGCLALLGKAASLYLNLLHKILRRNPYWHLLKLKIMTNFSYSCLFLN